MPAIGLWRMASPAGCNCGVALICWRMSGDALIRNQWRSSQLIAIEACVAAMAGSVRALLQMGQLQFHCGTPPPAAAPRTIAFNMLIALNAAAVSTLLALGAGVHVDVHANLHFADLRCFPSHPFSPLTSCSGLPRGHDVR